jgi:hypothetical protein
MSATPQSKTRVTLSTRVSFEDAATLRGKASQAGLTISKFLRQLALTGEVKPRPVVPEINKDHWIDLGRMGGNLNQIAAHLNAGGITADGLPGLLAESRQLLADVRATLIGAEGGSHGVSN